MYDFSILVTLFTVSANLIRILSEVYYNLLYIR